jgi:hypothetical protein
MWHVTAHYRKEASVLQSILYHIIVCNCCFILYCRRQSSDFAGGKTCICGLFHWMWTFLRIIWHYDLFSGLLQQISWSRSFCQSRTQNKLMRHGRDSVYMCHILSHVPPSTPRPSVTSRRLLRPGLSALSLRVQAVKIWGSQPFFFS